MSGLDGAILDEFTEGINAPKGPEDAGKFARVTADGRNIEYVPSSEALVGDEVLSDALAPHLQGEGLDLDGDGKLRIAADGVTTVKIADAQVTPAKISNRSARSLFGRSTGTDGVGADISLAARANTLPGRLAGGDIGALTRSQLQRLLIPRPRQRIERDYFDGGLLTDGSIGSLGWRLYSGTVTKSNNVTQSSSSNRTRLVSAVAGSGAMGLGPSGAAGTGIFGFAELDIVQAIVNPIVGPANFTHAFGLSDNAAAAPAGVADCVAVYCTQALPNWQAIVRSGGAGAPFDTGVAVSGAQNIILARDPAGTGWSFYVEDVLGATIPSVPTGNLNPFYYNATTTGGASAETGITYFMLQSALLGGAFDNDNILDA
jgi:hypothetical protein